MQSLIVVTVVAVGVILCPFVICTGSLKACSVGLIKGENELIKFFYACSLFCHSESDFGRLVSSAKIRDFSMLGTEKHIS